jgi:hypothetical protein
MDSNDAKYKYFIYKKKYIALKKKLINQNGGTIEDVYRYLEQNISKIESSQFQMIEEFAHSFLSTNEDITVSDFISQVRSLYGINLPPISNQRMPIEQSHRGLFRPSPIMTRTQHLPQPQAPRILAAQPIISAAQPRILAAQPRISAAQPRISAAQPIISAAQPRISAAQPIISAAQPRILAAQPIISAAQPRISAAQPRISAAQPRISAARNNDFFGDLLSFEETRALGNTREDEDLIDFSESTPQPNANIARGIDMFRQFRDFVDREHGADLYDPIQDARLRVAEDNLITVYTTGLAHFEAIDKQNYIRALIENIVETCERAGKRVRFIHYDMFNNLRRRYYRDERFVNGFLTIDIIQAEIENNLNALLVDLAHVIHYYHNNNVRQNMPLMNFYAYEELRPSYYDPNRSVNINSFYPGYIGDMETLNFIRNFKFFQFINGNIITFIQKGLERNIKIREIYKGDITTFLDFTINQIDITGLIANVRSPIELNLLFWH